MQPIILDIHKCPRQFRQSDWTKRGGVLTDGNNMAYQNKSSAYVLALNQSEWLMYMYFHVSPKCEFVDFYLVLFNKMFFFVYILKTKSIQAFMNAFGSVLIASAQIWLLTCGKDKHQMFIPLFSWGQSEHTSSSFQN